MESFAVLGILVNQRDRHSPDVQKVMTKFDQFIIGRMGTPDPNRQEGLITLNLKASAEEAQAFAQELSQIQGVTAKAMVL